jgi:hypothetical protein
MSDVEPEVDDEGRLKKRNGREGKIETMEARQRTSRTSKGQNAGMPYLLPS